MEKDIPIQLTVFDYLQIEPTNDFEQVKKAYHHIARKVHPDKINQKNELTAAQATEIFQELQEFYSQVNTAQRLQYYVSNKPFTTLASYFPPPTISIIPANSNAHLLDDVSEVNQFSYTHLSEVADLNTLIKLKTNGFCRRQKRCNDHYQVCVKIDSLLISFIPIGWSGEVSIQVYSIGSGSSLAMLRFFDSEKTPYHTLPMQHILPFSLDKSYNLSSAVRMPKIKAADLFVNYFAKAITKQASVALQIKEGLIQLFLEQDLTKLIKNKLLLHPKISLLSDTQQVSFIERVNALGKKGMLDPLLQFGAKRIAFFSNFRVEEYHPTVKRGLLNVLLDDYNHTIKVNPTACFLETMTHCGLLPFLRAWNPNLMALESVLNAETGQFAMETKLKEKLKDIPCYLEQLLKEETLSQHVLMSHGWLLSNIAKEFSKEWNKNLAMQRSNYGSFFNKVATSNDVNNNPIFNRQHYRVS